MLADNTQLMQPVTACAQPSSWSWTLGNAISVGDLAFTRPSVERLLSDALGRWVQNSKTRNNYVNVRELWDSIW